MKKLLPLLLIFLAACQPNFTRKWDLQYEVVKQSLGPITYSVSYVDENGASKIEGPITDSAWKSEKMENVSVDFEVSLKVKIISGSGVLDLRVLRDGAIHKSSLLESPAIEESVETEL